MADRSAIEWTEATWNPTTGCDRVSPGCDNCYALTLAKRLKAMGSAKYQRDGDPRTSGPGFGLTVHEDALSLPLRWRAPRRIFVNSMSDLFHDAVPAEFIAHVFAVMSQAPQHTFQVLTKRHARMRSLLNSQHFRSDAHSRAIDLVQRRTVEHEVVWPLPNVWLGVSVETQQWADIRIPALLDTPAAVRWISAEPLLSAIDLSAVAGLQGQWGHSGTHTGAGTPDCPRWQHHHHDQRCKYPLDWVVTGGESGPGARPAHPDWFRSLRDQCQAAGVAYHHKQNGEWRDGSSYAANSNHLDHVIVWDGRHENAVQHGGIATDLALARLRRDPGTERATVIARVGKKAAGRLLDGRTWDEYPVL